MSEQYSDFKQRQRELAGLPSALAPLPPETLAWRRRAIRFALLFTFVGGIVLSMIPGPKRSSTTTITRSDNGMTTQVFQYSYSRTYGSPFAVARVDFGDDGRTIKRIEANRLLGIVGNLGVAFVITLGFTMLMGRRRGR